jgi:hypothetical protein
MAVDSGEEEVESSDNITQEISCDGEARWLKKGNRRYFGYKRFIATISSTL